MFWDTISLCSPSWPETCSWPPASASRELGLQVCAIMPDSQHLEFNFRVGDDLWQWRRRWGGGWELPAPVSLCFQEEQPPGRADEGLYFLTRLCVYTVTKLLLIYIWKHEAYHFLWHSCVLFYHWGVCMSVFHVVKNHLFFYVPTLQVTQAKDRFIMGIVLVKT